MLLGLLGMIVVLQAGREGAYSNAGRINAPPTAPPVPLFRVINTKLLFMVTQTGSNPFEVTAKPGCLVMVHPPPASTSRYGVNMSLLLFHDGQENCSSIENDDCVRNIYSFRFTPDAVGDWGWELVCPVLRLAANQASAGTVVVQSVAHEDGFGGVVAAKRNAQLYERENGSTFTPLGYEMDWLWALGLNSSTSARARASARPHSRNSAPPSIEPVEGALDVLGGVYGFNYFLVSFYANHSEWNGKLPAQMPGHISWAEDAANTPWDPAFPSDQSRLNLRYLKHWDKVLDAADARGLVIHLMLYVGNKNVNWPARLGSADDIYWHNVMARFAAHPAVIIDVSKEAASYGVGTDYVMARLKLIHQHNAHKRLVTAHSGLNWSGKCPNCNLTMVSAQTHTGNHSDGSWYAGIRESMDENPTIPVANVEFMYMAGVERLCNGSAGHDCAAASSDGCGNDPSKYERSHCADLRTMRSVMWGFYMALSSSAWYDCDTAWDFISLPPADPLLAPAPYRWMVHLKSFWGAVDRTTLEVCGDGGSHSHSHSPSSPLYIHDPSVQGHCLRAPAPHNAEAILYVWGRTAFSYRGYTPTPAGSMQAFWFDPLTGKNETLHVSTSNPVLTFTVPDSFKGDAVLRLTAI